MAFVEVPAFRRSDRLHAGMHLHQGEHVSLKEVKDYLVPCQPSHKKIYGVWARLPGVSLEYKERKVRGGDSDTGCVNNFSTIKSAGSSTCRVNCY